MRIKVGEQVDVKVPYEIREVVELHARDSGRQAKIHFIPEVGWLVRFTLRSGDKRLKLEQEQRTSRVTEDVYFHVAMRDYDPKIHPAILEPKLGSTQAFVPLDILQMGAEGVKEFLEAGDTWSGRGVFRSQMDALKKSQEANRRAREKKKEEARERSRERVKERWGKLKGNPLVGWTRKLTGND